MKNGFLLIILFSIFVSQANCANDILSKRISIHVENYPLHKVFTAIEIQANISFAFQSNVVNENQLISINVSDECLQTVLLKILQPIQLQYFISGTQIIIYKTKDKTDKTKPTTNTCTDTITYTIFDTIQIFDTTFVKTVDTVKIYDTLIVNKQKNIYNKERLNNNYISLCYGFMLGTYESYPIENSIKTEYTNQQNFIVTNEAFLKIGKISKSCFIESGIGYRTSQQNILFEYLQINYQTETRYRTIQEISIDTLSYVALPGIDTAWNIRTDTNTFQKPYSYGYYDSISDKISYTNSLSYLSIPISVGYIKKLNTNVSLTASLKCVTHILLSNDGFVLQTGETPQILHFSKAYLAPVIVTGSISAGIEFLISKSISFSITPQFSYQITPGISISNTGSYKVIDYGISIGLKKLF